jgi:tRNA(Arg) A34 adenosine deaminase TadA
VALDDNDNIIAMGCNSYVKTHPRMKELAEKVGRGAKQYLHAEVSCILKACGQAKTLIVGRLLKDGSWAMAKPCEICAMAIAEARINVVYYTGKSGELILYKED